MRKKINPIVSESLEGFKEPEVSLYDNMFETTSYNKIAITEFLMSKKYKSQVEAYRGSKDKIQRDKIKRMIECITPSSRCNYRQEDYFKEYPISQVHTGLICIDIDSKDNESIDLEKSKHLIGEHCPSLYYAGLSIGGEGIFLIFRISDPKLHKQHFDALVCYIKDKFNLNVDRAVRNPVSLRAASYDENPYYNPNPTLFKYISEITNSPMPIVRTESEKIQTRKHVENAVSVIEMLRIDITNKYNDWFRVGAALAHEFGEEGRHFFHKVSRFYNGYQKSECDLEYDKCLKYKKRKIKIGTFFHLCKSKGIEYWKVKQPIPFY